MQAECFPFFDLRRLDSRLNISWPLLFSETLFWKTLIRNNGVTQGLLMKRYWIPYGRQIYPEQEMLKMICSVFSRINLIDLHRSRWAPLIKEIEPYCLKWGRQVDPGTQIYRGSWHRRRLEMGPTARGKNASLLCMETSKAPRSLSRMKPPFIGLVAGSWLPTLRNWERLVWYQENRGEGNRWF